MQNQVSEIQSANSSKSRHQMFWEELEKSFDLKTCKFYLPKFGGLKASDLTKICSNKKTILENIAEKGRSDIMEYLFESYGEIDIDKKYNEGNTLLHIAVKKGNSQLAEFLIKKGARIEILSDGDQIPLTLCPDENIKIKELLQNTQKLDRDLHEAIKSKDEDKISELLESGARPNGGITQEVGEQTVSQGKVRKGKFVSNIRLAIESNLPDEIIGLLMNKYVKTTSNPLEIACSSDKKKLFEYLCHEDYHHFFEKNIPNLLNKSIQHGSVNMVSYLLNDYDINYKYENEFNNNALQVAISNQFHFKTVDEKARGKKIINLLIDKIIEKYPQHEEILSCENKNGFSARYMLSCAGEIGKELLDIINIKIKIEKQKEDDRMARQKEYADKIQKRDQELKEGGQSDSNPRCLTALCCCMNVNVERVDVVGVKAELVFEDAKENNAKTFQGKTSKDQQPIEFQAPSNINSMQKISGVSIDSSRVNANSVGITLKSTPAVTPSPSQGGVLMAIEASSTTLA